MNNELTIDIALNHARPVVWLQEHCPAELISSFLRSKN
jgi:hypothetical protein